MFLDTGLRRATLALAATALLGAAPAALMAETPADTLVIADKIDDIVSIDPAEGFEFSGTDLMNNTYDTLVELDPERPGELVPGLAESWSLADDGVTYTFKMREGVTFASGNPVTAEAAAYSLRRVVKLNKTPSFIITQFGFTADNVDDRITFDGDTVTMVTDKQYAPSFVYNCMTAVVASIVDMETVEANAVDGDMGNEWLKSNTAGTGAYVLRTYRPADGYVLEAREGHWRGDAKLKRVFMRHVPEPATQRLMLEQGDVDIARKLTPVDLAGLEGNDDVKVMNDVAGYIFYIALNQKRETLNDPKVIEAMKWLIDREAMAESFLKGQFMVHQGFLPRGYLGAIEDTPYHLDVEKAKALLEEAGVGPFTTTLSVRNNQERLEMAQAIQNTFAQAGITLELKVGTGAEILGDYRARNHHVTLESWGPDYPDPHTNASTFAYNPDNSDEAKATGQLAWRTAYDPGPLNEAVDAAVTERDTDKRRAMYEEMQRTWRDSSPFIPLFQQIKQTALRSNVEGFHSGGSTDQVTYWLATK
jgi:peptide/nickel transport system substrate-binding protein